ncbi:MAG: hypothetical protein BMS9Abin36_1743 [Gammaproteobacteria bacterium]|nr:MAG: hypothetical protein BMS9Abin36_1743 [Gammaproteobacteria bacterium]
MSDPLPTCRAAILAAGLLCAAGVHASDGLLEINQACAVSGGCFTGDGPGFPVTITTAGSYLLTGNLSVASNGGAIVATVAGVQLDLNGFEVAGGGSCSATIDNVSNQLVSVSCSGAAGFGIDGVDSVRNGTVRGFSIGINTATSLTLRVDEIAARENSTGINAMGTGLIMTDSIVSTGFRGVSGQNRNSRFTIRNSVFERNNQGIYLPNGVLSDSVFYQNGEALRSSIGGRALVINSSFTANASSITGADAVFRSNVFDNNGTIPTGTNLGNNICDAGPC